MNSTQNLVEKFLGRKPLCKYEVVVFNSCQEPVVIQNYPYTEDGRPMPTLFWLISPSEVKKVSRLESLGMIKVLEDTLGLDEIQLIHQRYEKERDQIIHSQPLSASYDVSGGVGGTKRGIKCLHAHLAYFLAGHDDLVGLNVAKAIGISPQDYQVFHKCLFKKVS